jgi:hypothetical protein
LRDRLNTVGGGEDTNGRFKPWEEHSGYNPEAVRQVARVSWTRELAMKARKSRRSWRLYLVGRAGIEPAT